MVPGTASCPRVVQGKNKAACAAGTTCSAPHCMRPRGGMWILSSEQLRILISESKSYFLLD